MGWLAPAVGSQAVGSQAAGSSRVAQPHWPATGLEPGGLDK